MKGEWQTLNSTEEASGILREFNTNGITKCSCCSSGNRQRIFWKNLTLGVVKDFQSMLGTLSSRNEINQVLHETLNLEWIQHWSIEALGPMITKNKILPMQKSMVSANRVSSKNEKL